MKELKKGDFTGIYSSIDGKPLYFTGVYSCMEYDGMPCVFLATDLHNNLTFCRWSQQDLNKRGFTIAPRPVEISKTAMQMIQKAGAVIRWTTAAERKAANTDHKRRSPYILTAANGGEWYTTGTCADVREILKAANAKPLPEESMPESCQKSPQEENMRRFTIYTDSNMAGIDSRGAYTTLAEARMRLEKELDEDETSRGGYIFDELRQKVTAIYNGFNLEKIPEPYRGTPNEYTTRKEAEAIRAALEEIKRRHEAQEAPTRPETVTAEETPADATKARQEASQDATPATAASTAESVPECPTTAGTTAANETPTAAETAPQDATTGPETSTPAQDTTGSDTRPPRAAEKVTTGNAAGDTSTPANQEPGTAAGAITGRTTTPPQNPGHACENAPGRTERATPGQVHATHAKRPPRAPQRATTHGRPRGHPEKTANFCRFYPLLDFPRTIFANFQGIPISVCIFGPVFDPEFWSPKPDHLGGIKISCNPRRKNFQKIFLDGGKYNGKIYNACT